MFEFLIVSKTFLDLLHIKPAPNNGTAGSLRHLLNPKFLKTLPPVASKRITQQNCGFPDDLEEALKECKTCVCPYCNVSSLFFT